MTKTITAKQRDANQRNAKKSTGPRSLAGKARTGTNALKHGLTAERVLLPGESAEEFEAFRTDILEHLAPEGPLEEQLVERAATLMWRLKRVPAFEAALFEWMEHYELEKNEPSFGGGGSRSLKNLRSPSSYALEPEDAKVRAARVATLRKLEIGRTLDGMFNSGLFDKIIRYDTALQRQLKETLKGIAELQKQRFDREKEQKAKIRPFRVPD